MTPENNVVRGARTYTCEDCGGTFEEGWTDEEAHAEAVDNFGRDGRATDMAKVCDDCYRAIMADLAAMKN